MDNYISDVNATWTSTGTFDSVSGTGSIFTFNPITAPTSGRIVATTYNKFSDTTGIITVLENPSSLDIQQFLPTQFILGQCIPNPFNSTTKIFFQLPKTTQAILTIYDISGRKVKELVNRIFTVGRYSVVWDGTNDKNESVGTGIYLAELRTEYNRAVMKMILIK